MENESIKKINKLGKIAFVFSKVVRVFLIIGFVACLGIAIATACLPKNLVNVNVSGDAKIKISNELLKDVLGEKTANKIIDNIDEDDIDLDINDTKYDTNEIIKNDTDTVINATSSFHTLTVKTLTVIMIGFLIKIAILFALMVFVSSLCKAFKDCKSPFEEDVINKMKKTALFLIPWAIVNCIGDAVVKASITKHVDISLGINLPTIILILIIIVITYVFQYGAMLQKEADETL